VEPEQGPCVATADASTGGATATADGRVVGAWCAWLGALATNAEAALAAALAYKQLGNEARDHWLAAVEKDVEHLNIPRIAAFAPLLAVEVDPERRLRISNAIGSASDELTVGSDAKGLAGYDERGMRVCVVITPLYLDFVQVLACGYHVHQGFEWVRHEPILCRSAAPTESQVLEGATLEWVPMQPLVDELAHAVVAHRRSDRQLPEALGFFAHLFDTHASSAAGVLTLR
jgi:hypothetical protein